MARKLRLQYEGAIYHITVRGNGRREIFLDDHDRDRFLWRLCESRETYEVRVYLYCLMDNHFHLVVETPRGNLSRFMQSVLTGYTVYFNLRHHTSGHVLQGRYGAQVVEGDEYLLTLSRYVHLNPVRVRKLADYGRKEKTQYLRAYRWSSYRGYIDRGKENELMETGPILSLLRGAKREREQRYRKFVEAGLIETDEEFVALMKEKPRGIGSREFRTWLDGEYRKLKEAAGSREDVSFRKESKLVGVEEILGVVAREFRIEEPMLRHRRHGCLARAVAAKMLCKHAGLTQREAGEMLGYGTGAAVSMQLKSLREKLAEKDGDARRHIEKIERRLKTAILNFKV